jgi:hypothetical protein
MCKKPTGSYKDSKTGFMIKHDKCTRCAGLRQE